MIAEEWEERGWTEDNVYHTGNLEDYLDRVINDFLDEFEFAPYN